MDKLRFGTAGIPWSAKGKGTEEGVKEVRRLGLDSMELEFVQSVNITMEKAPLIKEAAKQNDIILTFHSPYYINLNSADNVKIKASVDRIMKSARVLHACGGWSACMHAAFYTGASHEQMHQKLKPVFADIVKQLKDESIDIWLRPEIGGKKSQYGSLEEIIKLSEEVEGIAPCVDYAHFHARDGGSKTHGDFASSLALIEKRLGKEALHNMHMHVEGIEYTDKGEKNHLNLEGSDLKYKELLKALKDFNVKGVAISESPNIEEDALLCKKEYTGV